MGHHPYDLVSQAEDLELMSHSNETILEPRFSAVIPVYNCEQHIAEAIQSVLDQSFPAFEIIVVNDGSSDDTATVIQRHFDCSILSYVYQENQGVSAARNRGAALAQGDWIAFLDADDLWHADKLRSCRDYILRFSNVGLFWSDMNTIDATGHARKPEKGRDPLSQVVFNRPVGPLPSSVVMRKDVFDQTAGFDTRLRCYEDSEYFLRVATAFPIMYIPGKLFAYRKYDKPIDYLRTRRVLESWAIVHSSLAGLYRNDPKKSSALRQRSASVYSAVGRHYLRAGNFAQARFCFRQSFAHRPFYRKNLRRWALSYLPGLRTIYRQAKKHGIRS